MYRAWICENCSRPQKFRDNIFICPSCQKECCDDCGWKYAHHKECCEGKTDIQLREESNAVGYGFED